MRYLGEAIGMILLLVFIGIMVAPNSFGSAFGDFVHAFRAAAGE